MTLWECILLIIETNNFHYFLIFNFSFLIPEHLEINDTFCYTEVMLLTAFANLWHSNYRLNKVILVNFIVSLVLNLVSWIFLAIKIAPLRYLSVSGTIPLHYNLYFGVDVFGQWYHVFALPLFGLCIIIFNNLLGYVMYEHEKLLSYFLVYIQTITHLILVAASIFIILLNI